MDTTTHTIPEIIEKSLVNAFTYDAFKDKVAEVVAAGKSTGNEPNSEALIEYSKLTFARIKRNDKTTKLSQTIIDKVKAVTEPVTWIVLTESWCGDAGQTVPVINKIAELNPNITLKVLLRDDNDPLMNEFLTNGGKSIPKLIAYDTASKTVKGTWGPRPSKATKLVNDYKTAHGTLTPEFKQDLQVWYNKDKGQNTADDIVALL